MSRARDLADLLDASGDVKSAALDNVPPSNDASALTTGTLPAARLPSSGVDAASITTGSLDMARVANGSVTNAHFASGAADLSHDTTPQLGGALDTNGNNISFGDDDIAQFGDANEFTIKHQSNGQTHLKETGGGSLFIDGNNLYLRNEAGESYFRGISDGSATLYHNNNQKLITTSSGVSVTGDLSVSGSVGGLVLMNKQTTTIYTTTATTHNVDFSNIPSDGTAKAALVTLYVGSDADHIDWHFGRSTNNNASWNSGPNDPGWNDSWGDILLTWVGNVGGYSWWMGSLVIPVNSNGSFNATCAGASNRGNRLRIAGIGYFK